MVVITYTRPNLNYTMLVYGAPDVILPTLHANLTSEWDVNSGGVDQTTLPGHIEAGTGQWAKKLSQAALVITHQSRLLHNSNLMAVGLSVGFENETWSLISWF